MQMKYVYARLFDHCVKNDFKTSARSIIRRKERVPLGIFSYFTIAGSSLLLIYNEGYQKLLGFFGIITAMFLIFETRMGMFSLINYLRVKRIRDKLNPNILEQFCVYHNEDGNYIKLHDGHIRRVLNHPFDWCIVSLLFYDDMNNRYVFRISLKGIFLKIKLSRSFKKSQMTSRSNGKRTFFKYNIKDLDKLGGVKELTEFLRNQYLRASSMLSEDSRLT